MMPVPLSRLNTPLPTRPATEEPVMATPAPPYTAETITTHTHRWTITPDPQNGTPLGTIEATVAAAADVVRRVWELPADAAIPGDALVFTVEAGRIVVSFTVREPRP